MTREIPGERSQEAGRALDHPLHVRADHPRAVQHLLLGPLAPDPPLGQLGDDRGDREWRERHEDEQGDASAESESHGSGAVSLRWRRFACLSFRRVRPNRLAFPLAILLSLLLAAPAAAAFDWTTQVVDFEFQPAERKISVGDTVTWNFGDDGHTSASLGGQPDSWKSADTRHEPGGNQLLAHSSTRPGSTSTCASSTGTS